MLVWIDQRILSAGEEEDLQKVKDTKVSKKHWHWWREQRKAERKESSSRGGGGKNYKVIFFNSQIEIISNAECHKMFQEFYTIDPKHICGHASGSPPFFFNSLTPCCYQSHISGVDACQGDSGGPASIIQGGRQTQVKCDSKIFHSPGWRSEYWGGMRGPKIPRVVYQGQLTDGLDKEYNIWIHCVGQQLQKYIAKYKPPS